MEHMQGFTGADAAIEEKEYFEDLAKEKKNAIENSSGLNNNTKVREKIHYLGDFRIVGQIVATKSSKAILGYVVMNEKTKKFKAYTVEQTTALIRKFKFVNAELKPNNDIVNTECAMTSMPKYNLNLQVIDNFGVIILGEIVVNDKSAGYRVIDTNGRVVDLRENDVLVLSARGVNILNAKIVNKDSKQYISAIKKEFTKIEKSVIDSGNFKVDEKPLSDTQKWRNERHIANYVTEYFPRALAQLFTQKYNGHYNSKLFHFTDEEYNDQVKIIARKDKEIRIITKEVLVEKNGYELSDKDKKLIEQIASEYHNSTEKDKFDIALSKLCQFALTNKEVRETFLKAYMRGRNITHVKSDEVDEFIEDGVASEILVSYLKRLLHKKQEYEVSHQPKEETSEIAFDTSEFSKGIDMAQLGFVLDRSVKEKFREDGYHYITKCGSKVKLKCLEDCFDDFLDDGSGSYIYNTIKGEARCLGDILAVADIEKLTRKLSGAERYKWQYISEESVRCMIEIIVAIAYLYDSRSMKTYLEMNNGETKVKIEQLIGRKLPDYEEISSTDYKLDPSIRIYYASGFNVFYKDDKLFNYRKAHNSVNVYDSRITGELASIVNMVTSDECDGEEIGATISHLRFF